MKLTQHRIENLKCPAGKKDMLVFDEEQSGLGVRVTMTAKKGSMDGKTFLAQYRVAGNKRRVPLGSCSAIGLSAARDAVKVILGSVALGRDPAAERKDAARQAKEKVEAEALTLGVLIENWQTRHLATRRPGYAAEAPRALRIAFAKNLKSPAAHLAPKTVKATITAIADDGKKATARLTGSYGSACYSWAIDKDLLTDNPFAGIKLEAVPSRERVLTDEELLVVWRATAAPGSFNAIVRMLILTGQRRNEVSGMAWDEISPDVSTWTIPGGRTKNGTAHIVPLSSQARSVIQLAPRIDRQALVFPGLRGPFVGWGFAKTTLDKDSGVKDWRLHDLRRTVATGLQRLGVRLEVTEAILNHVSGSRAGIVGVYQRHSWADEKRAALNAWGAYVEAIVEKRDAEPNVVAFVRNVVGAL